MASFPLPPGYKKPPKTLTRAEFLQRKPGGNYGKYTSFVTKTRARRAQQRQNQVTSYDPTQQGPPPSWMVDQARASVDAQTSPLIAELTRSINDKAQAGQQAISGLTNQYVSQLQPLAGTIGGFYDTAQAKEQALNASLAQNLRGQGAGLADELAATLSQAGQSTSPADEIRALGKGVGDTQYALGSASLSGLIGQGAAAQTYAAKLPGIAQLGGLQYSRDLQAQSQAELANATGEIRSQVPGLVQSALSDQRNFALQQWLARQGFLTDQQQEGRQAQQDAWQQAMDLAGVTGVFVDPRSGRSYPLPQEAAKPNSTLSKQNGFWSDEYGNPILDANGKRIPWRDTTKGGKGGKAKASGEKALDDAIRRAKELKERTKTETQYGRSVETPDEAPYGEAFRDVLQMIAALTPALSAAQRRKLTERALAAAGYKKPPGYRTGPRHEPPRGGL